MRASELQLRAPVAGALAVLAVVVSVTHADAQPLPVSPDNSAAVEALFSEGKRLVAEGRIAEACPKFLASYNLDSQRVGTLLNLADCYEKNHQLASAWARYVDARPLAQRANQIERRDYAAEHAAALEPRLARLTIVAPRGVTGLVITRDGVALDPAVYGVAVPVDAGSHSVSATAPGRRAWSNDVVIDKEAEKRTVEVPLLVVESAAAPAAAPRRPASHDEPPTASASEERHGRSARGVVGLVLAGVGVVGLGVGAGFGVEALGKKSESDAYCGKGGTGDNECFGDGVTLRSDAVSNANVSTIFFAAGAALVAGGLVLWLTAPSSSAATSNAGRNPRAGFAF